MLELICTVLGLIQGGLVALNRRSNWVFYLLQMSGMLLFSFINRLYGDMVNNAVYIVFGVIGYLSWGKDSNSKITIAGGKERVIYCLIMAILTAVLFIILKRTNDPLPLLDAFTTASSFVATYYMVRKKLDAWVIWFVNDLFYIVEYLLLPNQSFLLASLNLIWTILAICTFFNWRRIMKQETKQV